MPLADTIRRLAGRAAHRKPTPGCQMQSVFLRSSKQLTALLISLPLFSGQAFSQALEEVIVTAQKREQSLQDVPIAVSAYSGAMLEESGIKDVFDLQVNAPALTVDQNQNATTSTFAIRGIGGGGNNFGIESSVGVYVDGTYRARQNSMISNLVDMQSVEVLRGPQGTLFGRNTLSGAIHFKTVAPNHEQEAFVEATAGNMGLFNISGAANVSVVENVLALRFTGFHSQRDGWIDNLATEGDNEINDRDRFGLRAQALWTPTDTLSARLIVDYGELDEVCCGTTVVNDNLRIDQRRPELGVMGSDVLLEARGGTFIPESRIFDKVAALSFNPISQSEDRGVSVEVNWDVADEYTLTSITAWRDFESFDFIDADFSDLEALSDTNLAEQSSITQEFRVTYTGDKLNYVAGLYYFNQDLDSTSSLEFGEDTEAIAAAFAFPGVFSLDQLSNTPFPLSGGATAGFFVPGDFATDTNSQEHESWAIFGQFDYLLTDALTLTAGLRYTNEEKKLVAIYTESSLAGGFFLDTFPATFARDDSLEPPIEDEQITGTVKLSWFVNDSVMAYGSFSTGYKSGGTNTDRIDPVFPQQFGPETVKSYELGMKAEFEEQRMRLNVSLFYAPVDDYQVGTFTGSGFNVTNAATINTYGGEVELLWQASDSTRLQAAYAKNVADFDKFEGGNCWVITPFRDGVPNPGGFVPDPSGAVDANNDPIFVPYDNLSVAQQLNPGASFCDRSGGRLGTNPEDFLTLSLRQDIQLADSISATALVEYIYNGDMVLDQSNEPYSEQDAFNLVNLRFKVDFENYGASVTLWGRNVFDEEYNGTSFPAVLQDGKQIAYRRDPATFGLTVQKNF